MAGVPMDAVAGAPTGAVTGAVAGKASKGHSELRSLVGRSLVGSSLVGRSLVGVSTGPLVGPSLVGRLSIGARAVRVAKGVVSISTSSNYSWQWVGAGERFGATFRFREPAIECGSQKKRNAASEKCTCH